jgi:hypothetical protein
MSSKSSSSRIFAGHGVHSLALGQERRARRKLRALLFLNLQLQIRARRAARFPSRRRRALLLEDSLHALALRQRVRRRLDVRLARLQHRALLALQTTLEVHLRGAELLLERAQLGGALGDLPVMQLAPRAFALFALQRVHQRLLLRRDARAERRLALRAHHRLHLRLLGGALARLAIAPRGIRLLERMHNVREKHALVHAPARFGKGGRARVFVSAG